MKIVTFGEVLLRLSPPGYQRFVQASTFDLYAGGAEANVAVALAQWGADARHVSRVPAHELGDLALGALRRYGVDTRGVLRGGDRLGLYFLEHGASQRGPKVIYDRAASSFTGLGAGALDWDALLDGADWLHWTGITAALGDGPRAALREALAAAKRLGVRTSVDLNYRAKLWTTDEACAVMTPLVQGADVCVAGREDAAHTLGEPSGATTDSPEDPAYAALAARLRARFGFGAVAIALRESFSASRHGFSALLDAGHGRAALAPLRGVARGPRGRRRCLHGGPALRPSPPRPRRGPRIRGGRLVPPANPPRRLCPRHRGGGAGPRPQRRRRARRALRGGFAGPAGRAIDHG